MARLDVHARRDGGVGYLLDVQADLLSGLNTRLVVPLLSEAHAPAPAARLNPLVDIAGEGHVVVTPFAATIHARTGGSGSRRSPIAMKRSPPRLTCLITGV